MGINDLQLSAELIGLLYPESLVDADRAVPDQKSPVPAIQPKPINSGYPYLGKNEKSICFLVSFPQEAFIPDDELRFLERMLTACHCHLQDIALVNMKQRPVDLKILKEQLHPRILFLWGALPAITGLDEELPDLSVSIRENISIVPVSQAARMGADDAESRELKKSLWILLKKIFNL